MWCEKQTQMNRIESIINQSIEPLDFFDVVIVGGKFLSTTTVSYGLGTALLVLLVLLLARPSNFFLHMKQQ